MAEPRQRAGRTRAPHRPARALLLASAILTVVLGGLFAARPAAAAPVVHAAPAAAATPAGHQSTARLDALVRPDGGICNVPGIGDIGGLLGLCNGGSGVVGDLNNVCSPGPPQPEQATAGIDSLISTPGGPAVGKTLYDNYGMSGQFWAATGLKCSDMTSLIGNNVAGMVFDMAKSLDRVTITVYQSAAGSDILSWLSGSVDRLISALGNAIYFPFLAPLVILGAIWLAWQGLVRKRATRTLEGTIWMVVACAAAIWLIGRPADFTGVGTTVSNGVTSVLNTAFAKLPATTGSNCLPVANNDPQSVTTSYAFTSANGLVDQNANELWSVLVCKPWLDGEFGTTVYAQPGTPAAQTNIVNQYGRQLLWAQSIATNEQPVTTNLIQTKQQVYNGISAKLAANEPGVYPLFQGNQWTTRLEIGFSALFAAVAAGLLVLLIALTLIILKLGFLLLLVAGPFFLIVGIHPGFGRVVAIRWFEMLVGVLMKQVAIALVLSILLYCYSLIMGTTDQVLPWALKIMMIALVTVAVFIYRKPFQHLFSSVGYGVLGNNERAEVSWRESAFGFRRVSANAAGVVVPGFGASRAARWARRGATPDPAAAAAAAPAEGGGITIPDGASVVPASDGHATARQCPDVRGGGAGRTTPPPLPLPGRGGGSAPSSGSASWARGAPAETGPAPGTGARSTGTGASSTGTGARSPGTSARSTGTGASRPGTGARSPGTGAGSAGARSTALPPVRHAGTPAPRPRQDD